MTPYERKRLANGTILATFSIGCWCLAIVSWLAQFEWGWDLLQKVQCYLAENEIAGQGHCWLCGMSRAFRAIWFGQFQDAMRYNPYSPVLFCTMILGCSYIVLIIYLKLAKKSSNQEFKKTEILI